MMKDERMYDCTVWMNVKNTKYVSFFDGLQCHSFYRLKFINSWVYLDQEGFNVHLVPGKSLENSILHPLNIQAQQINSKQQSPDL
jgi:hypothetical protein